LILKSIPIVVMKVDENESLEYRSSKHVFPTPKEHRDGSGEYA
jgi:hypothetical protein